VRSLEKIAQALDLNLQHENYLLMIVMVGLGGLEPPTSHLSGAFVVLYV
jgi:hypothetical protein